MDNTALFKVGYGLYVLTTHADGRDNGCIINTVMQITSISPLTGVIAVNKQNHTHDMIVKSGKFNVSILTTEAPFDVFKSFGFQSGSKVDKFVEYKSVVRSENGVYYLTKYVNAYMSFKVIEAIDFGSHTMFKAEITDGMVLSEAGSVTYDYYQKHIKLKPQPAQKPGYRCNICSYVYEGDILPDDFICPLCKHGANDFTKIANSKEEKSMENLKGTKTEKNLMEAFAGESQARNKYTYYAGKARKEGYEQIAALFEETAVNEKEHAKIWFKLLCGGDIPSTIENLKAAAGGENEEWTDMYKRMTAEAREEGFDHIAFLFEQVGKIEKEHEERYLKLLKNLEEGTVFARKEKSIWICRNCGYIVDNENAPQGCPVCVHPQAYFELRAINY